MKHEAIDLDGPCELRDWTLALIAGEHDAALAKANAEDARADPELLRIVRGDVSHIQVPGLVVDWRHRA